MFNICGSRSFSHEDGDKNGSSISSYSTPKTSKKSKRFSRFTGKDSTKRNPYSDRGLDKFYSLLAELDDKKQKIYSHMGVEEVSFVRFVYSDDSTRLRPVVVRVKNKNSELELVRANVTACSPAAVEHGLSCHEMDDRSPEKEATTTAEEKKEEFMKNYWRWNGRLSRRRYCCFALMILLTLLFLAICGRSFAIICITISWYFIPRIVGGSSSKSKVV